MIDAHFLSETGWPPDVLDRMPIDRIQRFLLYKAVRHVAEHGGSYDPVGNTIKPMEQKEEPALEVPKTMGGADVKKTVRSRG